MNDFLLGVIVGGVIASICPVAWMILVYLENNQTKTSNYSDEDLFDDIEIK